MAERKQSSSNYMNEVYLFKRCSMNKSMDIIKRRWVIQILFGIYKGANRFSELKANIVLISDFMLGKNLKSLVKEGILKKIISEDIDEGKYYEFTEKGQDLMNVLLELRTWSKKYKL